MIKMKPLTAAYKAIDFVFRTQSKHITQKKEALPIEKAEFIAPPKEKGNRFLLGFSKEKIREKESEIIEFAELGRFIDMPVKTYSSGMYSKLAFAITATLETDVVLIDEVLSVGDEQFKKKSYKKMKELISNNERTVVIVSHNLGTIEELCNKVLWLHEGKIRAIGETKEVMNQYKQYMNSSK